MRGMMGLSRIRMGMMGMRGIRVRIREVRVGMMGMQRIMVGMEGMWGIGVGIRGIVSRNEGNQGENLRIGVELLN